MKASKILIIIFLLYSKFTYAGFLWQGISVSCLQNNAEIKSYNLSNKNPNAMVVKVSDHQTIYYGDKHEFSCKLKENTISGRIKNIKGSARGMCGSTPGSYISINVNNKQIFEQQLFNNDCFESLDKVSFEENKWIGFVFKICGKTGRMSNPKIDGCFEFNRGLFEKLKFPLPKHPISNNYVNKYLN